MARPPVNGTVSRPFSAERVGQPHADRRAGPAPGGKGVCSGWCSQGTGAPSGARWGCCLMTRTKDSQSGKPPRSQTAPGAAIALSAAILRSGCSCLSSDASLSPAARERRREATGSSDGLWPTAGTCERRLGRSPWIWLPDRATACLSRLTCHSSVSPAPTLSVYSSSFSAKSSTAFLDPLTWAQKLDLRLC